MACPGMMHVHNEPGTGRRHGLHASGPEIVKAGSLLALNRRNLLQLHSSHYRVESCEVFVDVLSPACWNSLSFSEGRRVWMLWQMKGATWRVEPPLEFWECFLIIMTSLVLRLLTLFPHLHPLIERCMTVTRHRPAQGDSHVGLMRVSVCKK
ncbi:hypothetical protein SRHO_G00096620 [Serrasalmus rhombeus]